jgi:hypothetical protein
MRCIVSTQSKGAVAITYPTRDAMAALTHGGAAEGYCGRSDRDRRIADFVAGGIAESVAVRWVSAWLGGGLTDAEAYELVRDKDTKPDWTGMELWDCADVPSDRWFRSAWHRSQNGGPISINLGRAKALQLRRITDAVVKENERRSEEFDGPLIEVDISTIRNLIARSRDEIELRSVWSLPADATDP